MIQKPIQKACTVDIRNPNVRFSDIFQIFRLLNRSDFRCSFCRPWTAQNKRKVRISNDHKITGLVPSQNWTRPVPNWFSVVFLNTKPVLFGSFGFWTFGRTSEIRTKWLGFQTSFEIRTIFRSVSQTQHSVFIRSLYIVCYGTYKICKKTVI